MGNNDHPEGEIMFRKIIAWCRNFAESFDEFCAMNDMHDNHFIY